MTTIEITSATKVTMLKHLVAGKDLDLVATLTRVPRDTVLDCYDVETLATPTETEQS